MAHPNIIKAREDARASEADFHIKMQVARVLILGLTLRTHQPVQSEELQRLEGAVDDLKGSIVHLTNARQAVDFWEDS